MPDSNMVHRIRLRGPWQLQPVPPGSAPPRSIRLPACSAEFFDTGARSVQLSRRFNRPTNLAPGDRISLGIENLPKGARVTLNGARLDPKAQRGAEPTIFPTSRLEPHNLLTVEFEVASMNASEDQTWGDVALVIDSP